MGVIGWSQVITVRRSEDGGEPKMPEMHEEDGNNKGVIGAKKKLNERIHARKEGGMHAKKVAKSHRVAVFLLFRKIKSSK